MEKKINDGGSWAGNATMRDVFAAHAPRRTFLQRLFDFWASDNPVSQKIAEWNYAYADAMLVERSKPTTQNETEKYDI